MASESQPLHGLIRTTSGTPTADIALPNLAARGAHGCNQRPLQPSVLGVSVDGLAPNFGPESSPGPGNGYPGCHRNRSTNTGSCEAPSLSRRGSTQDRDKFL